MGRGIVGFFKEKEQPENPAVAIWKDMYQCEEKKALEYQAGLYHAWNTIRAQQKGMQRQARRMKRVRAEGSKEQRDTIAQLLTRNSQLATCLDSLDRKGGLGSNVHDHIRAVLDNTTWTDLPPDFVDEKDLKEAKS